MRFRGKQALAAQMDPDVGFGGVETGLAAVGRAIRIGGQTAAPGEARVVGLPLPGRADVVDAIPVWVAVGPRPGPRVTVVGAVHGFEAVAALGISSLCERLNPADLSGGLAIAPVLRPGGRFAARGQAVSDAVAWHFPGDPGGNRRSREAFAIFSELIVGSTLLVVVTEPEAGREAIPIVRADLDDARLRRLALAGGATAVVHARPAAGTLGAAAREMGIPTVEVVGGTQPWADGRDPLWSDGVTSMLRALLVHVGAIRPSSSTMATVPGTSAPASVPALAFASIPLTETVLVRAPSGGLFEPLTAPGRIVERGAVLARIAAPLSRRPVEIRARHDALVLETTARAGVRSRAPLFVLGRVTRAVARARTRKSKSGLERRRTGNGHHETAAGTLAALPVGEHVVSALPVGLAAPDVLRIGWVESVSLPALGVKRLRAKIDTGARTSALHVTSMKVVGTTDGPHRRAILEITVPGGRRRAGAKPVQPVRVQVRDHVLVKDTSGHTERRPVIETTLRLGTVQRRIRVTLTDRGDMLFPMLIGRTALGSDVLVDPARRSLLRKT